MVQPDLSTIKMLDATRYRVINCLPTAFAAALPNY